MGLITSTTTTTTTSYDGTVNTTNIYELAGECSGDGSSQCNNGYYFYVKCPPNIGRGEDACVTWYVLDSNGNPVDIDGIADIGVQFTNKYGCSTGLYGSLSVPDEGDDEPDFVQITSLQENVSKTLVDCDCEVSSDKTSNISEYFGVRNSDILGDGTPIVMTDGTSSYGTGCVVLESSKLKCYGSSTLTLSFHGVAANASDFARHPQTFRVCINGELTEVSQKLCSSEISPDGETDIDVVFSFEQPSDREYATVQVFGPTSTVKTGEPSGQVWSLTYITVDNDRAAIKNKGLVRACFTEEQTNKFIRGDLKISGVVVDAEGNRYATGCTVIATIS